MHLLNLATVVTVLAVAVAAPAIAGKGGNGSGADASGASSSNGDVTAAAKPSSSSPYLSVSWPLGAAQSATSSSVPYVVSGCGFGSTYVSVVAYSPAAISFTGDSPDANGCISVSNFSTNGAGAYKVSAFQQLHGSKATEVAATSFTVG